jgi:pimeloyl-ACP methyl ester carboxylesterase
VSELDRFTGRFFDRAGLRLHYLDQGAGEPIVMVHGNPTWSYYYRNLVRALGDDYRVIVPDHIGCGLSDKPQDDRYGYRLVDRVNDLEALLDHLGVRENITLVVHDWGGMIGMAYAHRHPVRIARLVILNTGAFRMPASKRFPWQLWVCRNTPLGPLLVRGLNGFVRAAGRMCTVRPLADEVRRLYAAPYDSWAHRIAVLRFVEDIPLSPADPSYALVAEVEAGLERFRRTPTLICWGERDFVFDQHFLAEWRRRLPEAEVHAFADAGHFVLEDAGGRVEPLVKRFLAAHPLAVNSGPATVP